MRYKVCEGRDLLHPVQTRITNSSAVHQRRIIMFLSNSSSFVCLRAMILVFGL